MRHYQQTTDFTCDPACLMMAIFKFNKNFEFSVKSEMGIWNEANLITVPGCLPQGLALSALKRGVGAEIICKIEYMNETTGDDVSISKAKEQFSECLKCGVGIRDKVPSFHDIEDNLNNVPIVLVSAEKVHNIPSPHWIVVSRIVGDLVYFNDPLLDKEICLNKRDFMKMFHGIDKFLNRRMLIIRKICT